MHDFVIYFSGVSLLVHSDGVLRVMKSEVGGFILFYFFVVVVLPASLSIIIWVI